MRLPLCGRIRWRTGLDETAFAELYLSYLPRVFNYMVYRVGSQALAEELTADVFERAWRKRGTYRSDKGAFSTWLLTIARHVATDYLRRQGRRNPPVSLEDLPEPAAPDGTPEDQYFNREAFARLVACLATLPEREQEVITLRFAEGLSNEEIAGITGLSAGNVRVIVHRALRELRKRFEEGP